METSSIPVKTFTADQLSVRVFATPEELALAAALAAQRCLQEAIVAKGSAAIIFACATSQMKFLEALAKLAGIDWSRITVFHMDEYLGISSEHQASFRRFLRERVIQYVRPRICYYLEGDALLPLDECERYTQLLKQQTIDLCCLGIGENGHIAFNDPDVANFHDPRMVKLVKLDVKCRQQQVGEGFFPHLPAVPQYAMTLTIPALCAAQRMLCIVPDQRKAQAVKDTLQKPVSTACPASILRQQSHATLFLDASSASLL